MSQVQCRLLQVIINQSEESIVCVDQSEQPIHCSLQCYQSLQHQTCSEQFYKESVKQELSNQEADTESKQRMVDILQRMNDDQDDEGVDSDDDEDPLDLADRLRGVNLDDAYLSINFTILFQKELKLCFRPLFTRFIYFKLTSRAERLS